MIGPHRIRERINAGHPVFGPILNFNSPWAVDIAGLIGFDFVMIDAEHGPLSPQDAETMIRAAEQAGLSPLVRVPVNRPHEVLRFLDVGAVGVQIPHIDTPQDAKAAVAAVRYPPAGNRGVAASTRAAGFGIGTSIPQYLDIADREIVLLAMIENQKSVANIDAIAAHAGIDGFAIGPTDLSASMGLRGVRTAAVEDAIDRVIAVARLTKKWVSLPAVDAKSAKACIARGANIVFLSTASFFVNAGKEFLANTKETALR